MKKLLSAFMLTGLLLAAGCAHHEKCSGQCDVKKGEQSASSCCKDKKGQCDVKKKSQLETWGRSLGPVIPNCRLGLHKTIHKDGVGIFSNQ